MLKTLKNQAIINTLIENLNSAYAEFKVAHAAHVSVQENARMLNSSAAAAKADAERIHDELRELLRETLGRPTKELRQKTAEKRAALELHEEYSALAESIGTEITLTKLAASLPGHSVIGSRHQLRKTYADLLISEAIEEIAPRLKLGMAIQRGCIDRFDVHLAAQRGDRSEVVFADLRRTIQSALTADNLTELELPEAISTCIDSADLHGFNPMSHAEAHRIRCTLNTNPQTQEQSA